MCAAAKGHSAALRTLINAKADVHSLRDKQGRTAAQMATSTVVQAIINVRAGAERGKPGWPCVAALACASAHPCAGSDTHPFIGTH